MIFVEIGFSDLINIIQKIHISLRSKNISIEKIVYIERGGIIPAFLLQHLLGGELIGIHARRPENRIKKIGSNLYSMIPRVFREILRKIDLKVSKNNLEREVILDSSVDFKQQESILIVDDSLDTGSTLTSVKDALVDRGANPKRIKIVVINTTLDTSIIKPDFVYKRNVIFGYPWSQDSKEHSKFLKLYKNYQRNLLTPENLWSYLINNF